MVSGKFSLERNVVTDASAESLSWHQQVRAKTVEFLAETSLHGLKHVVKNKRHKIARFLWLVLVLTMSASLVKMVYDLYSQYYQYQFRTYSSSVRLEAHDFPAVSLCLKEPFDRTRLRRMPDYDVIESYLYDLLKPGHLNRSDSRVISVLRNISISKVLNASSFRVDEIVLNGFGPGPKRHNITKDYTTLDYFTTLPLRCFTYNAADRDGKYETKKMSIFDQWGVYLRVPQTDLLPNFDTTGLLAIIHDPWNVPINQKMVDLVPGSATTIIISPTKNKFLPAPYKSFGGKNCQDMDAPGYRSTLKLFPQYSWSNCIYESVVMAITTRCNCTSLDGNDTADLTECSLLQLRNCNSQSLGSALYEDMLRNETCLFECTLHELNLKWAWVPFPSNNIVPYLTDIGVLNNYTSARDLVKVVIKFESPTLPVVQHLPSLTIDDIFSRLGGQMGLFLGASLLTVTELVEHIVFILWSFASVMVHHVIERCRRNSKDSDVSIYTNEREVHTCQPMRNNLALYAMKSSDIEN